MGKPAVEQMSFEDLKQDLQRESAQDTPQPDSEPVEIPTEQAPQRFRPPATYTFLGQERTVPDKPRALTREQLRLEAMRDKSHRIREN